MIPFHPAQIDWEKIFAQNGGRFVGFPYQRGGSLGSLLRHAFDIVPALPDIASAPVTKEIVAQTTNLIRDLSDGINPLASLKRRGRQAVKNLVGLGKKKRVIKKKSTSTKRPVFLPALSK